MKIKSSDWHLRLVRWVLWEALSERPPHNLPGYLAVVLVCLVLAPLLWLFTRLSKIGLEVEDDPPNQ